MARPSVLHTGNSSSCLSSPVPNGPSLVSHVWLSGDPVDTRSLRSSSSKKDITWIQDLRSGANSGISTQAISEQTWRLYIWRKVLDAILKRTSALYKMNRECILLLCWCVQARRQDTIQPVACHQKVRKYNKCYEYCAVLVCAKPSSNRTICEVYECLCSWLCYRIFSEKSEITAVYPIVILIGRRYSVGVKIYVYSTCQDDQNYGTSVNSVAQRNRWPNFYIL